VSGSESVAGDRTVDAGTWESQSDPREAADKLDKGEEAVRRIGSRTDS
jgi:hypothetical protein